MICMMGNPMALRPCGFTPCMPSSLITWSPFTGENAVDGVAVLESFLIQAEAARY